jgi:ribosomal protein S2
MRTKMGKRQRIALQQQANADAVRAERDEARAELESVRQQLEGAVEALERLEDALLVYHANGDALTLSEAKKRMRAAIARAADRKRGQ